MRTTFFREHAGVFVAVFLAGFAMLSAAPAVAQQPSSETEARSVFAAGEVAFGDGRYADALGYFQRAHAGDCDTEFSIFRWDGVGLAPVLVIGGVCEDTVSLIRGQPAYSVAAECAPTSR